MIIQAQIQPTDQNSLSPSGVFEKFFDNYGNHLILNDVAIMPQRSISNSTVLQSYLLQTSGIFEIYYEEGSGMELPNDATHISRRNVINKVFLDVSDFLISPLKNAGNPTKIKIWIRNFDEVSSLMTNQISYGTSYYNVPKQTTSIANIIDNQLWKTLNGGKDAYDNVSNVYYDETNKLKFYHATFAFNFNLPNQWHSVLNNNSPTNKYDLYSYALREVVHALGYNSLISENGASKFGDEYKSYSRFDTFLNNQNNQKLINNLGGCNAVEGYYFVGNVADLQGNCNSNSNTSNNSNCGQAIRFIGTENIKLFTPNCFSATNSFNFSNNNCNNAIANNWLTHANFGLGNTQRYLNNIERLMLTDLGYSTAATFGDITTLNYQNYGSATTINTIVGVNDGFSENEGYVFEGNINENIIITNLLENDYAPTNANLQFECLKDITYPNTSFSVTSGNSTTAITLQSAHRGLHVLSYVPFDSVTGKRGNVTYILIYLRATCPNTDTNICDLVVNGGFNDNNGIIPTETISDITEPYPACNWEIVGNNTSDYFHFSNDEITVDVPTNSFGTQEDLITPGFGAYAGLAFIRGLNASGVTVNNNEILSNRLRGPLLANTFYTLSFNVSKGDNSNPNIFGRFQAYVSNRNPVLFNGNENLTSGNYSTSFGVLNTNATFSTTTNGWDTITFTFFTGAFTNLQFLYIGGINGNNITNLANGSQVYYFVDNVSLVLANDTQFNLPETICNTASILPNLQTYITETIPTTGTFTGPGVTCTAGICSFNPAIAGVGTHTITYTIVRACDTITITDTITVTNCLPPTQPPYISQVYKGAGKDCYVEVKNTDNTNAIPSGSYYLAWYQDGAPLTGAPSYSIDLGNIPANGTNLFRSIPAITTFYPYSIATPFTNLHHFDGSNDIMIITTSNDASAFANRKDIIGDNTPNSIFYKDYTLESYASLVRVSCPQVTFPKTSYDEQDWVGFSLAETSNNTDRKNSILGRHFSDVLEWDGSWNDLGILDPTNESNPDRSRYEIITAPYDATTGLGSFEACSLQVDDKLDIMPSTFVKVQVNVDVNAPLGFQILNVQDGGSLVMARDCYYGICGTALSSTGMSLKRTTNNLSGPNDYVYWSSPLTSTTSNPTAGQIFNFGSGTGPIFNMSRFYSFENQNYCDIYRKFDVAQPVAPNPDGYDDDLNDYLPFTHPFNANAQNQQLKPGRGYLTWPPTPIAGNYNYQIEFKGEMNNGIVSVPVFKNNSESGKNSNLVGNPFPSAIDLDKFFKVNESVIEPIVYVWGRISDDPNATPGPYGYNYLAGNYAVYTQDFTLNDQFNGTFGGGNILSSGQSFVVRTIKRPEDFGGVYIPAETVPSNISPATYPLQQIIGAGNLIFRNVMRTTAPNTTFSRLANAVSNTTDEIQNDKLWVNLTDTNNFTIQIGVAFKTLADANYKQGEDFTTIEGRKYDFYTQSTSKDLIIDIQDAFTTDKIIPLGITNISENQNQSFTISLPNKSGVFTSQEVYLYDNLFNSYHNLSNSSYSFATNGMITENRFSLRFSQNYSTLAKYKSDNQVDANLINDSLILESKSENIKSVWVYDLYSIGSNLIINQSNINNKIVTLPIGKNHKLFSVKIELEDGTIITKKMGK